MYYLRPFVEWFHRVAISRSNLTELDMARIAGVNIPDNKHAVISLTYIFGIGKTTAKQSVQQLASRRTAKIKDLSRR